MSYYWCVKTTSSNSFLDQNKVWPHVVIVFSFVLIPIVTSPDFNGTLDLFRVTPFKKDFLRHLMLPVFFYLHHFVVYSKYYTKRRRIEYFIFITVFYALICLLPELFFDHWQGTHGPGSKNHQSNLLRFILRPLFPFVVVWLGSFYVHLQQRARDYRLAKTNAELESLKYQLNPHFLFNTLNAIYALVLTRSDRAAKSVLKLSGIMRYVYTDSADEWVSLESELQYVEDYIDIMSLKTDSSLKINYTVSGSGSGLVIAPMILINFVENAFKYGYDPERQGHVSINLNIDQDGVLHMQTENKILVDSENEEFSTGIGHVNTTKRLEYLYPDRHKLSIVSDEELYRVDLRIWLSKSES